MKYLNVKDAYLIQKRLAEASPNISAWKLGGSNLLTRDIFGVSELFFGFLCQSQVFCCTQRFNDQIELDECEVEICVDVPENYKHSKIYLAEEIRSWNARIGLEFPKTQITDLPTKGVAHLIADNCASGALLIATKIIRLDIELFLNVMIDGVEISKKIGLIASVEEIVEQFLSINRQRGFTIEPGQIIATGGITNLITLKRGQTISVMNRANKVLEFTR